MSSTEIVLASQGSNIPRSPRIIKPYRFPVAEDTNDEVLAATLELGHSVGSERAWNEPKANIKDLLLKPYGRRLNGDFELLQLWEGYVISVESGVMRCRLVDKTDDLNPDEEVVISVNEIDPSDHHLIKPGAVFYWSIRYADHGRGKSKESLFRFRRLPVIKKSLVEKAREQAKQLEELFKKYGEQNS
jgi:hypothetical protein